jgi:hypothetical protein
MAFKKSIEETIEEEEYEEPKEESTCLPESRTEETEQLDHSMQPCEPIESIIVPKTKKRSAWLEATLQKAERLKAPSGTFRKSKKPEKKKRFSNYAACMTKFLNEEPTTFEEAAQKKQWKEAMTEEHQSIMKNDV